MAYEIIPIYIYNWVVVHLLYTANNQGFDHCSFDGKWMKNPRLEYVASFWAGGLGDHQPSTFYQDPLLTFYQTITFKKLR